MPYITDRFSHESGCEFQSGTACLKVITLIDVINVKNDFLVEMIFGVFVFLDAGEARFGNR